jgi:hypothetical protein
MPKEQDTQSDKQVISDRLAEIRTRLMASPAANELQGIQLQMDVLQRWAGLVLADKANDHDHVMATDHTDHDHAAKM